MSDSSDITVALITAGGVLLAAAVTAPPAWLAARRSKHARDDAKQARADAAVIKNEVKNSHTTNFREENDDRHAEVIGLLREHGALLEEHGVELKKLTKSDAAQNEWIDDFNNTWPRSRFMPPPRHRAAEDKSNGES